MSCQLAKIAKFQDIWSVKRYLFPNLKESSPGLETPSDPETDWDDDKWGWDDKNEDSTSEGAAETADSHSLDWLQNCPLSVSPAMDFLAAANENRLVLLSQKWDPQEKSEIQSKFSLVYQGSLSQEEGETITSVLCLPLASQKRSTHGGPDWTCLIVGFSTGYVRMYTENGTQLLSQIFSENPVHQLKCRTYSLPRHTADAEKHEELNILYTKNLVVIDGFSLYQTLKACRNQVARAAASGSEAMQPPPLAYKKWGLYDQNNINDFISCGITTPNAFDQMQSASLIGGYSASIRPTPPAMHKYVTAGTAPFVGVYCAIEGSTQPMLSDVAHAVAHKLKSALFSQFSAASAWLGYGGKQVNDDKKEMKKPKIEPATSLSYRYAMPDKRRHGESIVLAPDNKLAATTDSFGRVLLLDLERGMAVRIWKGYRDAQVGWMVVKESTHHNVENPPKYPREALFLVVYAPRRGILEVWTAQQGPRVAAFNVSKNCRLLCPGYGMMGLNNVTCRGVKSQLYQCILVEPDGSLKAIDIPFHLALSDKNSKRARDMHLFKKLKILLKDQAEETDDLKQEMFETLQHLKTPVVKQQALDKIFQSKVVTVKTMLETVRQMKLQIESTASATSVSEPNNDETVAESMDVENKMLLQFCKMKEKLLEMYMDITKINSAEHMEVDQRIDSGQDEVLCSVLGVSLEELGKLKQDIDHYQNILDFTAHVRFREDTVISPTHFLNAFEDTSHGRDTRHKILLTVKGGLNEEHSLHLASFLFGKHLSSTAPSELIEILKNSTIPPEQILKLLLELWLSTDKRNLHSSIALYELVKCVTSLKEPTVVSANNGHVSPWWRLVRQACSQTSNICASLILALVSRTAAANIAAAYKEENTDTESSSDDWESVTLDSSQWTLLIKQLEDLQHVQCLLKMKPDQPDVYLGVADPEPGSISIKKVLEGGRGIFAELVGLWVASQGLKPSMINRYHISQSENQDQTMDTDDTESSKAESHKTTPMTAQFEILQKKLPYSLDCDVLMANCCWEYAVLWNKDPEVVARLEQAMSFLKYVQNPNLQHGIASMMWHMFILKRFSACAFLMEKVGKAPKERLCHKEAGMSDIAVQKFLGLIRDLLDLIMQVGSMTADFHMLCIEDPWQGIQGSTSLVELAMEQKESNLDLVQHHMHLSFILHAVMTFTMRSIKPLSLFDTVGKSTFFKPLHSHPTIASNVSIDNAIKKERLRFLCRIITQAVMTLGDPPPTPNPGDMEQPTSPLSVTILKDFPAVVWPAQVLVVAREMDLDVDECRRCHTAELYSSGFDKQAEEVLRTVSDHAVMGSQLLDIAGQRLAHFIFVCDPPGSVEKLSQCSPTVSTWLKEQNPDELRHANVPLHDTAALIGQVVNQLPEAHAQYNLAISLVDLVQSLM